MPSEIIRLSTVANAEEYAEAKIRVETTTETVSYDHSGKTKKDCFRAYRPQETPGTRFVSSDTDEVFFYEYDTRSLRPTLRKSLWPVIRLLRDYHQHNFTALSREFENTGGTSLHDPQHLGWREEDYSALVFWLEGFPAGELRDILDYRVGLTGRLQEMLGRLHGIPAGW